jgi:hypothetical protein
MKEEHTMDHALQVLANLAVFVISIMLGLTL